MRTLIDIEKEKLQTLAKLAKKNHVSRASLIREAIDNYLESVPPPQQKKPKVFGLLKGRPGLEGLDFQKKLRSEWDK